MEKRSRESAIGESIFTNTEENHIINEHDYVPNAGLPFDIDSVYNMAIYG
jgi:hypothetical protein